MLKLTNTATAAQGAPTASLSSFLRSFLLLIVLFPALGACAQGQGPTWVSALEYGFDIQLPNDTLDAGDTTYAELHLDLPFHSADRLIGVDLYLELSGDAELPATFNADSSGSWVFGGTEITCDTEVRPLDRELKAFVLRNDSIGQNGLGMVLRIPIVAAKDNVSAADLLVDGGGLVLVDNVDMKTNAPSTPPAFTTVTRMDQAEGPAVVAEARGAIDLAALPPGLYFIVETDANGKQRIRKILKR